MEKGHNIFDYYRARKGCKNGNDILEDNVTKAFINVLEHINNFKCPNSEVCIEQFLNRICNCNMKGPLSFYLQVTRERTRRLPLQNIPRSERNLLLITSPRKRTPIASLGKVRADRNPRADALILGPNMALLIESKIESRVRLGQVKGELGLIGADKNDKRVIHKQWDHIYREIRNISSKCSQPSIRIPCDFLTEQFCDLIDQKSLSGFKGFRKELFLFTDLEEGQVTEELKFAARALKEDIYNEPIVRQKYSLPEEKGFTRHSKDRNMPYIKLAIKRRGAKTYVSQIIQFHRWRKGKKERGLEVYACIEGKALGKLQQILNKEVNELRKTLTSMKPTDYIDLYIYEGKYRNLKFHTLRQVNENPAFLNDLAFCIGNNIEEKGLTFTISRYFEEDEALNSGTDIVKKIADAIADFHPFVELVNNRQ